MLPGGGDGRGCGGDGRRGVGIMPKKSIYAQMQLRLAAKVELIYFDVVGFQKLLIHG